MSHSHPHNHTHSHGTHGHEHAHAAPIRAPHRTGFSLIALSGLQRLALVLPVIGVLWLTAFWAMRSGG